MKYLLPERSTVYQQVFLAWLGVAVMLSAHGAPREVDVRETRALCQDPTVFFPVEEQRSHTEGRVVVDTVVDIGGNVSETKITKSSGSAALDFAAVRAARTIKCAPFRDPESGTVTSVHFLKSFVFRLTD